MSAVRRGRFYTRENRYKRHFGVADYRQDDDCLMDDMSSAAVVLDVIRQGQRSYSILMRNEPSSSLEIIVSGLLKLICYRSHGLQ